MEIRRQNYAAMERACDVIREAYADFERIFGRKYGNPFFEEYMTDDADVVLLGMGTTSTPVEGRDPQDAQAGQEGRVRAHALVPAFAGPELAKCLERFKAVGVIDRDFSFGSPNLSGVRGHRSAHRDVQRQRPQAAGVGLHLRAGWARGDCARRGRDDRQRLPGRGRQGAAADAMDRAARITRRLTHS